MQSFTVGLEKIIEEFKLEEICVPNKKIKIEICHIDIINFTI